MGYFLVLKIITFYEGLSAFGSLHNFYTTWYCLNFIYRLLLLFHSANIFFCSPFKSQRDSTNVVMVSHSRIFLYQRGNFELSIPSAAAATSVVVKPFKIKLPSLVFFLLLLNCSYSNSNSGCLLKHYR